MERGCKAYARVGSRKTRVGRGPPNAAGSRGQISGGFRVGETAHCGAVGCHAPAGRAVHVLRLRGSQLSSRDTLRPSRPAPPRGFDGSREKTAVQIKLDWTRDIGRSSGERYARLQPPVPTPPNEVCACEGNGPLKLSTALSYNPIHCVACNGEVPLEPLDLPVRLVDDIASWRSVYDSLESLWLDSGDYEVWAVRELSHIDSYVNRLGLGVRRSLDAIRRCYYRYFEDESVEGFAPRSTCPRCGVAATDRTYGALAYRVCDACSILWWGTQRSSRSRGRTG